MLNMPAGGTTFMTQPPYGLEDTLMANMLSKLLTFLTLSNVPHTQDRKPTTSRHTPHQGKREKARRIRQGKGGKPWQ